MKFTTSISFLIALVRAASIDIEKRDSPLDVKLEMVGNSAVKATVTNTGASNLKIFKTGSFLDESAVEKVDVFSGCRFRSSLDFATLANPFQPTRLSLTVSA